MNLPLKTIGGSEVFIITLKNTYPCLYTYTFLTLNEYSNEGAGLKILYRAYVVEAKTEGSIFYTLCKHVDNYFVESLRL